MFAGVGAAAVNICSGVSAVADFGSIEVHRHGVRGALLIADRLFVGRSRLLFAKIFFSHPRLKALGSAIDGVVCLGDGGSGRGLMSAMGGAFPDAGVLLGSHWPQPSLSISRSDLRLHDAQVDVARCGRGGPGRCRGEIAILRFSLVALPVGITIRCLLFSCYQILDVPDNS